jgi:hypothetical protein
MVGSKSVTFYQCEIISRITRNSWTIDKRYSEFKKLHDAMIKIFPRLPTIPGTTFFKVSSPEALKARQVALEAFLRSCVLRRDILQNKLFKEFLELEKNAPEVVGNDVDLVYDYKKLPLGCRNFKVIPHRKIMVVCCSNMNIIERSNILLTNFAFSAGNKCKIPMGAAFIYQCKPHPQEIYKIHKIWAKPLNVQTGAIHWEDVNEIFSIGLDDGRVLAYKGVPNTHYLQMNQICELTFHTDRIMGLAIDPDTLNIYTCSTDRTFYVTSLAKSTVENILINMDMVGYTNLKMDTKNKRIFLTNED